LLDAPPAPDETTDKGTVNRASALAARADWVARLYADPAAILP
jgi:hypothetical protein